MRLEIHPPSVLATDVNFGAPYGLAGVISNPEEHYRLVTYLGLQTPGVILDVGTFGGTTALCLAQGGGRVYTYDISRKYVIPSIVEDHRNIRFFEKDILTEDLDVLSAADLIFLDIDPHDGLQEAKFFNKLRESEFKGILIADDIYLNNDMTNWWVRLETDVKMDLTNLGHRTGTGLTTWGSEVLVRS